MSLVLLAIGPRSRGSFCSSAEASIRFNKVVTSLVNRITWALMASHFCLRRSVRAADVTGRCPWVLADDLDQLTLVYSLLFSVSDSGSCKGIPRGFHSCLRIRMPTASGLTSEGVEVPIGLSRHIVLRFVFFNGHVGLLLHCSRHITWVI